MKRCMCDHLEDDHDIGAAMTRCLEFLCECIHFEWNGEDEEE